MLLTSYSVCFSRKGLQVPRLVLCVTAQAGPAGPFFFERLHFAFVKKF
jgi:hypothetical protein